jgi:putative ABC transport system substrate-binding protein
MQLLRQLIPNALAFGVLADPAFPGTPSIITALHTAARTLGLQFVVANASTDTDFEMAFAGFSQQHVGAVLVGISNLYNRHTEQIAALAARRALPAMYAWREFVDAGGLVSYGISLGYIWHQIGIYTGRTLKGDKPADLPVQQITKIDLVINLKTAKALGVTVPGTLLATADEVIQ